MNYTSWGYTPAFCCMVILSFPINGEQEQIVKATLTWFLPPKFPHKHVSSGRPGEKQGCFVYEGMTVMSREVIT